MFNKVISFVKSFKTEKCITCGEDTGIPVTEHIDFRPYYIEGAGQMCRSCFIEMDKDHRFACSYCMQETTYELEKNLITENDHKRCWEEWNNRMEEVR